MSTINVSLPNRLKDVAQELVDMGFYSSFSDLVRDSLRRAVSHNKYDLLAEEALEDKRKGRAIILKNKKDIDKYFANL